MNNENSKEIINNKSKIINNLVQEETEIVMPYEQWEAFVRDINLSDKQIPSLAKLLKIDSIFEN